MIVSFEFYVMNFVGFVVDFYSHITSHVSQAFASCTHNTSYSLLNIVHVIVCVYGLTNQVWKILWVLCKTDLLLEKEKGDCLKSKFLRELGFKSWVCENHFIPYSCIFYNSSILWGEVASNSVDFQKFIFFTISINWVCFSINWNCVQKISVSVCLVRLIEPVFRSIEHHESSFF